MMVVVMTLAGSLQRRGHFVKADFAIAIGVHLAEHIVRVRDIGSTGAERVFEFGFRDLAVAVGVEFGEQVFQRIGAAGRGRRSCRRRRLTLRRQQRGHGDR